MSDEHLKYQEKIDDAITAVTAPCNHAVTPQKIEALEEAMRRDGVLIDLPVKHYFSPGVYARELFIPKGTILTGKIHKYVNMNIMSQGDITVLTEDGMKRVQAPFIVVSPAGTKRVAYAHEDTTWTTILGTEMTDIDEIESTFVAGSYAEYLEFCGTLNIEGE